MNKDDLRLDDRMKRETEAARDLIASLRSDDETLRHDMVEGETSLLEALSAAMDQLDEAETLIVGLKDREETYKSRRSAIEKRRDFIRGMIEQAVARSDLKSVRLPCATLSAKATPRQPIYTDEASIPAKFWKAGDPKLDKKAVKDALDAGEEILGVTLSNGGLTLQIRRQ